MDFDNKYNIVDLKIPRHCLMTARHKRFSTKIILFDIFSFHKFDPFIEVLHIIRSGKDYQ